jgi:hypothetical protein
MRYDKRQHDRFSVNLDLEGKALSAVQNSSAIPGRPALEISGEVADISEGGLCLLTADLAEVSDPVRCVIRVPHIPAGIPTLLQVRWARKDGLGPTYRVGLQFLV